MLQFTILPKDCIKHIFDYLVVQIYNNDMLYVKVSKYNYFKLSHVVYVKSNITDETREHSNVNYYSICGFSIRIFDYISWNTTKIKVVDEYIRHPKPIKYQSNPLRFEYEYIYNCHCKRCDPLKEHRIFWQSESDYMASYTLPSFSIPRIIEKHDVIDETIQKEIRCKKHIYRRRKNKKKGKKVKIKSYIKHQRLRKVKNISSFPTIDSLFL